MNEAQAMQLFDVLGRLIALEPSEATWKVLSDAAGQTVGSSALGEFTEEALLDARSDYVRLLVGVGEPLAAPWESVWANSERSMFQKSTLDVRRRYASSGLETVSKYHEPDDHIGYEMEYVSRAFSEGDEGKQRAAEFFEDHLGTFAFQWCEAVQKHAHTGYYQTLASITEQCLNRVQEILKQSM